MKDTGYDLVAFDGEGHAYAICVDDGDRLAADFTLDMLREGASVRRMLRDEAVRLHRAYLGTRPEFAGLIDPKPCKGL